MQILSTLVKLYIFIIAIKEVHFGDCTYHEIYTSKKALHVLQVSVQRASPVCTACSVRKRLHSHIWFSQRFQLEAWMTASCEKSVLFMSFSSSHVIVWHHRCIFDMLFRSMQNKNSNSSWAELQTCLMATIHYGKNLIRSPSISNI